MSAPCPLRSGTDRRRFAHTDLRRALTYGHRALGQRGNRSAAGVLSAVVVLAARSTVTADDLRAHCAEKLADYKVPRRIEFSDELPRNATGKILKEKLRQSLA